ncbi:MAG: haloacid dehalogenase [Verrucomicrobia bacterium]|nr:MAG: haloacid dehalogenase [Verrucomicrobiota bacterium]
MPIRAILFDLDDTLIADEAISHEAFERVATKAAQVGADITDFMRDSKMLAEELWRKGPCFNYCHAIGISAHECLWGTFDDQQEEIRELRAWALPFRETVFDMALRRQLIDIPALGPELAEEFGKARRRLQRLVPDAKEILVRLNSEYLLGLLTNGAPSLQREKLTASGLGSLFHAVAVSGEKGIGKPNPEIFFQLINELGVTAAETIMVGNSKARDIVGARNAGIRSIWIRVPGSEEQFDVESDMEISGLNKLPTCLKEMNAFTPSSR